MIDCLKLFTFNLKTRIVFRYIVTCFFSSVMFIGIMQTGLRWEVKQPKPIYTVLFSNGLSIYGWLGQNWSGDFVIHDLQGNETTFSTTSDYTIRSQPQEVNRSPWRLILTILMAISAGILTGMGSLRALRDWTEPKIIQVKIQNKVVNPVNQK